MKKKKIQLSKLNFDKNTVAVLSTQQSGNVVGGAATNGTGCATEPITCVTIPYTKRQCAFCAD
ncbi:hypothetical protein LX64_01417 [Chitinophaga skermanii]|uniref:Natural product n=1 Tax=Chitinophaga skermanii TaxID=331697 RepID=A0A327QZ99_9BACT|nr:class I lanthipeptide [Chitinophaga skermanii]RAJ08763.1 hypothetical protein LX64_01417 [Chitinophaga skermanii]